MAGLPAYLRKPPILPASTRSWAAAVGRLAGRQLREEWFGTPPHQWSIAWPKAEGQGAAPRDFRPADTQRGRALLAGRFTFDGLDMEVEPGDDVWNRPTPSRAFAAQLHRMDWLRDLTTAGEAGPRTALAHVLGWDAVFGRWNSFSWAPLALTRRVFNLACALKRVAPCASAGEMALLLDDLARQARHLLLLRDGPRWAAERAVAAGVAGCALAGPAGERLMAKALHRLQPALRASVLADGGHASRSPEAGLELLLDLLTLDDALLQLGREPPAGLIGAIDRLTAGLRFFTLADGRLACFQGGEQSDAARLVAARAHDDPRGHDADGQALTAPPSPSAPHSGYEILSGRRLQVVVDAAPPASGSWSPTACAQPLAIEVLADRERLITNAGWSARAEGHQGLRLTPAGSTLALAEASAGAPIAGWRARLLGFRLEGGATAVELRRHDAESGAWLELSHDGWAAPFGLIHERRLYLDAAADELRGEDRLRPQSETAPARRVVQFAVRFHLQPGVRAVLGEDRRSVTIAGAGRDWLLRHDAAEASLEPSVHLAAGRPVPSQQIVLRGLIRADRTGRIRWKLAMAPAERQTILNHEGHQQQEGEPLLL
jgi:uncharacterized heparinase superfamily protein